MTRWFPRLLLVTLLLQAAVYALRPMVSYRAISIGASTFQLGVIASSFAVLSLLVAVSIGRWVDRWGEPRFVFTGAAAICAVCLLLVWIDSVWALAASQALLGLGHIMTVVATQTLVANLGDPGRRDSRFGAFTVAVSLGQLVGPFAAGLVAGSGGAGQAPSGVGIGMVFAAAAVVSLLATGVAATFLRQPGRSRSTTVATTGATDAAGRRSYWSALGVVFRIPGMPHAMLASLTVLTAIDILSAYLPAYGEANGLSVETVGLLLATRAAASMASRMVMLPLIRLFTRRRLLALSTALPALSLALFPLLEAPALLYAAMVVIGLGLGLGQPITVAWVADRAPDDVRGTALGVRLSGNRLGQTVLPAGIGAVAGAFSLTAVFVSLAGLLGVSALAILTADLSGGSGTESA